MEEIQEQIHQRMMCDMEAAEDDPDVWMVIVTHGATAEYCRMLIKKGHIQEAIDKSEQAIRTLDVAIAQYPTKKHLFEFTLAQFYIYQAASCTILGQTDVSVKGTALWYARKALRETDLPLELGNIMRQLEYNLQKEISAHQCAMGWVQEVKRLIGLLGVLGGLGAAILCLVLRFV